MSNYETLTVKFKLKQYEHDKESLRVEAIEEIIDIPSNWNVNLLVATLIGVGLKLIIPASQSIEDKSIQNEVKNKIEELLHILAKTGAVRMIKKDDCKTKH